MSITEKILAEFNECRTNPSSYSKKLFRILKYYRGNIYEKPGMKPIQTEEGPGNVQACINYLNSVSPVQAFEWSNSLAMAAQSHADDIGPSGRVGHIGIDGSKPSDRIEKYCKWSRHLGENIDYGNSNPEDIALSLLIDDGVLARGQRLNIMKKEHKYVGIGFGYHAIYEYVCVIIFAEFIIENTTSSIPSTAKKLKKSEYIKIKEITPEESKIAASRLKKNNYIETINSKSNDSFNMQNYDYTQFSNDEIIEIKEFFDKVDNSSTGTVALTEVKSILEKSHSKAVHSKIYQILMSFDTNALGSLDFDEFIDIISGKKTSESIEENKDNESSINDKGLVNEIEKEQTEEKEKKTTLIRKPKFSIEMASEIKQIFDYVDHENSGIMNIENIKVAIANNELQSFNSTITDLMLGMDPSKCNNKVDFEEFVDIISEIEESLNSTLRDVSSTKKSIESAKSILPKSDTASYVAYRHIKDIESECKLKQFNLRDYEKLGISDEKIIGIKAAFDLFDADQKGTIKISDLQAVMEQQGFQKKIPEVYQLISEFSIDRNKELDFNEFLKMLTQYNEETQSDEDVKILFDLLDKDKLGYIELINLKQVAEELGDALDDEDIINIIRKSNLDCNGKVTYRDFYSIMSKVF